ncbi:LysM peptidoglycan-binding domain-containing protein [Macrococcoides canis]|uniref:LysM peptidoglycan-binding domain-containing protein n=1 Tax=Macrococcoides canis TaxID=1855823 RepID=UPI0020B6E365|nr:LysM peptidoglycan-binding domain-containing protein [Macrococcus canis]UTH05754.1 LysM peptidoglycan-binding domain-containing protein [Macrococcus canis]
MANLQEISTKFELSIDGMLSKFKVLEQNFDNLPKATEKATKRMDKAFGSIDDSLKAFDKRLSETGKDFDTKKLQSELQKAQKEFKETGNINKETMQSLQKEIKRVDWKSLDANSRDTFKTVIRNVNSVERNMNKLNDVKFLEGLPDDAREAGKQLLALQKDVDKTSKSLEKADDKVDFNKLNSELNKAKKELQSTGKIADNTLDQINKSVKDVDFESMSMSANIAFGKVEERADQLDRKLRTVGDDVNLSNSTKNISKDIDGATGSVGGLKGAFKGLGPVIGTALASFSIIEFTKQIVESTAEINALNSQYEQVMGDMKNTTDKYLGEMAQKYNVHPNELKKSMLQYQAILKSKGLSEQDAYETSKMWLERTVDGSAFANESMEESTGRMMAVIKGEYDSADTVMINLSQTMLNDKAQEIYGKKWEQLTVTQQEQLKVQESIRQHNKAGVFGQGVKEADSYEKNLAQLKNTWKEFLAEQGGPALATANGALKGTVTILQNMAKWGKQIRGFFSDLTGSKSVNILQKLGFSNGEANSIINWFNTLKQQLSLAQRSVTTFVKDGFGAIKKFFAGPDGQQLLQAAKNIFNGILAVVKFVFPLVKFIIVSIWQNIQGVIKGGLQVIKGLIQVFSGLFTGDFRKMWEGIKNIFSGAIKLIWNGVQLLFYGKLLKGALGFAKLFAGGLKSMWQGILNLFKNFGKFIWDTSMKTSKNVIGAFKNLWTNSLNIIKNLKNGLANSWNLIKKSTVDAAVRLKDGVVGAFKNTWNGIKGWIKSIKDGVTGMKDSVIETGKNMASGLRDKVVGGLNAMIDGVNWVADKLGMGKPLSKIKYSRGTDGHPEDGWATVGDKGPGNGKGTRELVQFPNGRTALFEKETTFWMPKGTHVYSNKETEPILDNMKYYSKGTKKDSSFGMGMLVKATSNAVTSSTKLFGAKNTRKAIDYTAEKGAEVEKVTRAGVEIAEDIMEYIEDPSKLVDLAMKKFGVDFSSIAGLPGEMMLGAYKKLKDQAVKLVTGWIDEATGGNADGTEILGWPMTTPYSPNAAVPGYPASFNGGRHYGIDLGIPSGTTIHAPTSGTVEQQSNYGGGIVARLLSGKIAQYFLHLSKVLKTGQVKQGDAIAKSGNSGNWTTGDHLHYQVESPAASELTNRNTLDPVKFLKGHGGGGGGGILKGVTAPGNISSWISSAIKRTGVPDSWAPYLKTIAKYESGFNPAAVQHGYVDVNTGGNEARGLMQVTPQTYRGLMGTTEGMMNPINNITASIKWIKSRYGSITNIPGMASGTWRGGYANGGIIPKDSIYRGGEEGKEIVIPTVPKRRKRANELIALADRMVNGKPKRYAKGTIKRQTHTVRRGDTLWDISRKNGTTVKALQLLNGIKNHLIYPGQIIKLTGAITGLNKNVSQQSKTHKATVQALSKAQRMYNTGSTIAKRGKTSGKVTGKEDIALGNLIMANMKNIGKLPVEKMQSNINAINKKISSIIASNQGKIATLNNKIKKSSNKKTIANARADIQAYQAQINSLKKLKQSEVLKTNFLNSLIKQKQRLQNQLNQKTEERKALADSKMSFRDSLRDSYRGYAGFEAAKGNTSRDFIAFMKYRLSRMKKFAANVSKLRKMGLDPTILREILADGIESAIPRVETLVGGGKKNVLEINKLQKQVLSYVNNLSNEHSRFGYDPEIKAKDKEIASIKKQQTSLQSRANSHLTAKPKTKPKAKPKATTKKTVASKVKAKVTPKSKPRQPKTHNIRWGDTLSGIAARYQTTVAAIKKLNGLKSDMIYAGRKLKIPGYAKGGIVDIPQIAWIAEGGFAESIISHDPSQRVQQQKIWKDTGDKLGFTKDDALTLRMIQLLEEQKELQRLMAKRETVLKIDKKVFAKEVAPDIDKEIAQNLKYRNRGLANV